MINTQLPHCTEHREFMLRIIESWKVRRKMNVLPVPRLDPKNCMICKKEKTNAH